MVRIATSLLDRATVALGNVLGKKNSGRETGPEMASGCFLGVELNDVSR